MFGVSNKNAKPIENLNTYEYNSKSIHRKALADTETDIYEEAFYECLVDSAKEMSKDKELIKELKKINSYNYKYSKQDKYESKEVNIDNINGGNSNKFTSYMRQVINLFV